MLGRTLRRADLLALLTGGVLALGFVVGLRGRGGPAGAALMFNQRTRTEESCGPVCIAAVTGYLGRPVGLAEARDMVRLGENGFCSFTDILRALRERDFSARALRFDPSNPGRPREPMILFVSGTHFVAAFPCADGTVIVLDPPSEPRRLSWRALAGVWGGEAIVIGGIARVTGGASGS